MFADKHYLCGFTCFQKIVHFPVHVGIDCSWIIDDSLWWFVVEKLKLLFLVCIDVQLQHGNNNKFRRRLITRWAALFAYALENPCHQYTLDFISQLLFTNVLSPQYSIVIKILMFYMNIGNVPLFILSLMHYWTMNELRENVRCAYYMFKSYHWVMSPCIDIMKQITIRPYSGCLSVDYRGLH